MTEVLGSGYDWGSATEGDKLGSVPFPAAWGCHLPLRIGLPETAT